MLYKVGIGLILLLVVLIDDSESQIDEDPNGYRLANQASYFIVAPRKIRPDQVVQLSISVMKLYYRHLNVRAIIRRGKEELAQAFTTFTTTGSHLLRMKVPTSSSDGNYSLRVEGSTDNGHGGFVFENETALLFERKHAALFIQFDKPVYRETQTVYFRIMPVEINLMSKSGSMDVYILDSTSTTVRRWLSMQTNSGGVLNLDFEVSEQPPFGTWRVRVLAFGVWYEKPFDVHELWQTNVEVNVSMPLFVYENDYSLAGIIWSNLTQGQPVHGTCKVKLQIRDPYIDQPPPGPPDEILNWPTIEQPARYFDYGVMDFEFLMQDIWDKLGGVSPAGKELYVQANVYDWFRVQEEIGWRVAVVYPNVIDVVLLGDTARTFKPNQTLDLYFAVQHRDGSPLSYQRRQLTVTGTETSVTGSTTTIEYKLLVGDDGIGHYRHYPGPTAELIKLRAHYDTGISFSRDMTAYRAYSPTNSYIYITSSTVHPHVDEYMSFTVTTNVFVEQVYYLVTCAGNIIIGGELQMESRQKTFALAVSRDMVPEAHMVVWHVVYDEVVADSMNFFVNGTRLNPVEIRINRGKDFSGDTAEVQGITAPSAYVAMLGQEYELWTYGWTYFISEYDIISELMTFDGQVNSSFSHTWNMPENQKQMVHFTAPSYGVDANTTFEYAGLVVFTDANVTRVPHNCNWTNGWHPCMDGLCYHVSQRCDGERQCQDGQDEMGCVFPVVDPFTPVKLRIRLMKRHYVLFGTWVWGGHFVQPNGRIDMKRSVPDEPTTWLVSGVGISKDLGFGIMPNPIRYTATRSFYMRAEAPELVVKGEQIGVRVILYNYWFQDVECLVTLYDSESFRFIVVEDFGIVSSYSPRTLRGDFQTMVFVEKGKYKEIQMPILPVVEGCFDVTVSAAEFIHNDQFTLTICTEYDGVTNYLHTPYFIDLITSGSVVLPDLEVPVPERFIKPEERQHLYVPGSPVTTVSIVGGVYGPGFFQSYLQGWNTIRKPFGSCEQSMYNFAVNLYALKYLKFTNLLTPDVLHTGLMGLNRLIQRLTGYMYPDISFMNYIDYKNYTPSTWVGSFTLRMFHEANDKDWQAELYIPVDFVNRIALWVCSQMDPLTGIFVEPSPIFDRKLFGNKTYNNWTNGVNVTMTAHVLITFATLSDVTGDAEICVSSTKMMAREYLERMLTSLSDPFEISIVTYALHVSGSHRSAEALNMLDSIRRQNEVGIYWADKDVPPNDIKIVDTIRYYQPRRYYDNEGYAVEATAYAMLTYLHVNRFFDSIPIMKWLHTMRNTPSGWASTQDTVIALKSLIQFTLLDTNRALYNIEVTVEATSMGNFSQKVRLDQTNWPLQQDVQVFPVWGSVRGRAQGTGYALMQMVTTVNVEYPHQILPASESKYFEVEIQEFNYTGRNYSIIEARVCGRWMRPDLSERSLSAMLEIHMPTGYVVQNFVYRDYAVLEYVDGLRCAEVYDGKKIIFYFDYFWNTHFTCVNFRADRWFPVANNTIQHILRAYDYHEPGMHNTTLYNTWHLFNLHICHVCGSFQCPYCTFYNVSPPLSGSFVMVLCSFLTLYALFLASFRSNIASQ